MLLMMSMNLSDTAILNFEGSDYGCIISKISKNEAKCKISIRPGKAEHYKAQKKCFHIKKF